MPLFQVGQGICGGSESKGWRLHNGFLLAPRVGVGPPLCLDSSEYMWGLACPPPTTHSGPVGCGSVIRNCADVQGRWEHDREAGALMYRGSPGATPLCLTAAA